MQACLHKHFLIQISIWWNHQASCFHEYGNKKMSWLNCNLLFPYLDCQDCHIISGSRHKRQRKIQHMLRHMLIWMRKCLCKQACNTFPHSNQRMAELEQIIWYTKRMNIKNVGGLKPGSLSAKARTSGIFI